jgi:iron complex transport system substrate-binding protein
VKKTSLPTGLALAVILGLALGGCQPGSYQDPQPAASFDGVRPELQDLDWLEDPKSWFGPSTALTSDSLITPVATNPPQNLPTTVDSMELSGELAVTISSTERVLALDMSGSLAATVWALGFGDRLIGRDISTTFPGVENLPVVTGSGHAISPESVLALRPDLIITDGTIGPLDVVLQLREAGVLVVFVRAEPGLDQPSELARSVASVFGSPEVGETLATQLEQEIASVVATLQQHTPTAEADKLRMVFLYLRGANGIYYLFGNESGAGDLIEALGGVDIATDVGWVGLRPMTDEALIATNPDLILVMSGGLESVGGVEKLLELKPALALTPAGQNQRFVDMADSQLLSFGPKTPQIIDALARAIYAPGG